MENSSDYVVHNGIKIWDISTPEKQAFFLEGEDGDPHEPEHTIRRLVKIMGKKENGILYAGYYNRCKDYDDAQRIVAQHEFQPITRDVHRPNNPALPTDPPPDREQRHRGPYAHTWPWIYWRAPNEYPCATAYSGKWMIFLRPSVIDRYWKRCIDLLEAGKLGEIMKVSGVANKKGLHVIIIYTYDFRDKDDCMRIRENLREIGIKYPISYKADMDTAFFHYSDLNDYDVVYRC